MCLILWKDSCYQVNFIAILTVNKVKTLTFYLYININVSCSAVVLCFVIEWNSFGRTIYF